VSRSRPPGLGTLGLGTLGQRTLWQQTLGQQTLGQQTLGQRTLGRGTLGRGTVRSPLALAGLLAAAGVAHLVHPKPYDRIVPGVLPGSPRTYTYVSGVAELALAAGLVHPRTRRAAGVVSAGFFAAVFPANVKMALDWRHASPARRAVAYGRLPLQLPLILWALKVARDAPGPRPTPGDDGPRGRPGLVE
jgi:uncharacterized membrane protein